jgi:hypothetical protein
MDLLLRAGIEQGWEKVRKKSCPDTGSGHDKRSGSLAQTICSQLMMTEQDVEDFS